MLSLCHVMAATESFGDCKVSLCSMFRISDSRIGARFLSV